MLMIMMIMRRAACSMLVAVTLAHPNLLFVRSDEPYNL